MEGLLTWPAGGVRQGGGNQSGAQASGGQGEKLLTQLHFLTSLVETGRRVRATSKDGLSVFLRIFLLLCRSVSVWGGLTSGILIIRPSGRRRSRQGWIEYAQSL
eukprot:768272-Hanusia_phi.AAC.12